MKELQSSTYNNLVDEYIAKNPIQFAQDVSNNDKRYPPIHDSNLAIQEAMHEVVMNKLLKESLNMDDTNKDKMVDGHNEEKELERRGFTPKDVFGKDIHINGKDRKIIDAALYELYDACSHGLVTLSDVESKDIAECRNHINKMWDE